MPATTAAPTPGPASAHFDLVSHWRLQAPVERVWAALADPAGWPRWWPQVQRVDLLRPGDGTGGLGCVRSIRWATRLPYRLVIEVETVEIVPLQRLRGRSRGQLDGEGLWLLRADGDCTNVTYVWRVQLARGWQRWLAPVLAPVFRWNHAAVMRAGEAGLARHLRQPAGRAGGAGPA